MPIDQAVLKNYLTDDPPTVVNLAIKPHFEALSDQEKLYSHWLSVYVRLQLIYSELDAREQVVQRRYTLLETIMYSCEDDLFPKTPLSCQKWIATNQTL
jgi:hypothetical protein